MSGGGPGHCDRCGAVMEGVATPGQPLLCPPCRAALPPPPARRPAPVLPLLAAVAVTGALAWTALKLKSVEERLELLDGQLKALPKPPENPFAPGEAEALKALAKRPPPSREDLEALKADLAALHEEVRRPAGMGLLKKMPPPAVAETPAPAPPAPEVPPIVQPAPPPPEEPEALDLSRDLASEDAMTRHQALALVQRSDQAPAAARLLKDELGFVRRAAAEALGRLKVPETVPALAAMARSEKDLLARRSALQALEAITRIPCLAPEGSEADALGRCEAWWEKKRSTP